MAATAEEIIARLGLQPHPEGGHYREMFRANDRPRGAGTAIYFLLKAGERSHWHRVDAAELWIWNDGHPLTLLIHADGKTQDHRLAPDTPQVLVPAGAWQAAEPRHGWALVSCVVTPGFDFAGFELAPPGWSPA